ncbi:MAG: lytic transglycosylase domain-containing protein [Bdellovibrionales bacterium]|nr:lytic transglycosylase domain-containing protein [Bdellovibrionales bacterium]
MRKILITSLLVVSACASKERRPAAVPVLIPASDGAVELDQALQQGATPTVAYLKTQVTAKSYDGLNGRDPAAQLPTAIRAERITQAIPKDRNVLTAFIRKFREWTPARRAHYATQLQGENFHCGQAVEAQAMAMTLEIDFPEEGAMASSQALHEKGLVCQAFSRQESLFKLAVFAIQKGDCNKATEYLGKFPDTVERGVSDRLNYLRSFCSGGAANVAERNPWGGYGILLGDAKNVERGSYRWTLGTKSGSEDWDRLLASFVELYEKNQPETIQYLASKINYDKLRALPVPFQTSMLVMMNFAGADLPVFQTLHKFLGEHPEMATPAVANLLFPVRYWNQILENSKNTDPVLVKALIRQESAFNPMARSRARAAGLMQLIYPTAKNFGVKKQKDLVDPNVNIHAGSEFLAQLINDFGSVELALAAYNAGPAAVRQWQKRYQTKNIDLFVEMIPYTETREYVRLVRRNYKVYQAILPKPTAGAQTLSGM